MRRVKIKVCGLTNVEDYRAVVEMGADFAGFIFYPRSPRYIEPEEAKEMFRKVPKENHQRVGVFVNETLETVKEISNRLALDILQLHGDETPEYVRQLIESGFTCWKAIRIKDRSSINTIETYPCDTILIDTYSSSRYGGTGNIIDLELVREALKRNKQIVIAGGISPQNIHTYMTRPCYALDINSTIETHPGRKDHQKLHQLKKTRQKFLRSFFQKATPRRAAGGKHFGPYGGRYVPEMLTGALEELEKAYTQAKEDPEFQRQLTHHMTQYSGRPTPLYYAGKLSKRCKGSKIYLKMEGLNHTGAHKINNVLGQALLAKRMGKTTLIAETGAGQHGLATAAVAAKMGFNCKIFMGETDINRQYPNVYAMKLMGAEIIPVTYGTKTLKDSVNETLKHWIQHLGDTHYLIGSALGPHPYPQMVRDFQSVIGREVRFQLQQLEQRGPDILVACVGGGSNSMGLFHPFLEERGIEMIGVEAGGVGDGDGEHAARFGKSGKVGIVQGYKSYFLQDDEGQVLPTHSISAGLDYAGIGPELACLHDEGRIQFDRVTDEEALEAFQVLCREEGIIPALESSHAVAYAMKLAPKVPGDRVMVVNLSGRGDKDLFITAKALDRENWFQFLNEEITR